MHLVARPSEETILSIDRRAPPTSAIRASAVVTGLNLDVIFPVLHGPYGEDGTIQGLLELANVPYVGAGVLASAVGMDKAVMKVVFAARGLPVCPYRVVLRHEWQARPRRGRRGARAARSGSRCSSSRPTSGRASASRRPRTRPSSPRRWISPAASTARSSIEAAVPNAREIECAVLGNDTPEASVPGEVVPSREFYDYEAKYLDDGSKIIIPADLPETTAAEVQRLAIDAFRRSTAPAWRASTSCSSATPATSSSTR